MLGSGGSNPVETALLQAILVLFFAGDFAIAACWVYSELTGRRLLARTWSVADLFLGIEAVLGFVLIAAVGVGGVIGVAAPRYVLHPEAMPARLQFYMFLLPCMAAQEAALIAVPAMLVWVRYRQSIRELGIPFRPDRGTLRRFGLGALLALPLLPVTDLLGGAIDRWVLQPGRIPYATQLRQLSEEADALHLLDPVRHDPLALLLLAGIVAIVGPVAEEVFFRGFGYRILGQRFGRWAGLILSSLLFAAIHVNPAAFVPIFAIGLLLAWMYDRTGDLSMSVGLHCANNGIAFVLYLVSPTFSLWERLFGR